MGQNRRDAFTPVAPDDPAMPTLLEWQKKVTDNYNASESFARAHFSSWAEQAFPSLKSLFPQLRFFTTDWSETPAPGKEREAVGLGLGIEVTLVCDSKGKLVKELFHTGNYDPFGELLAANKVAIRSDGDAKLVWEAFCDVHQRHWKEQPARKVSDPSGTSATQAAAGFTTSTK